MQKRDVVLPLVAVLALTVSTARGEGTRGTDTPGLPGSIPGVEPEAHSHHPPMVDGNGNLYRLTETIQAQGNYPRMMKSANGGVTWSEVDAANRPKVSDLEGCWQIQAGSTIYVSVSQGIAVSFLAFNTSDAANKPDQWVTKEIQFEKGLGSRHTQFSSLARTSDGQFWIFYSDALVKSKQQIAYRRRTGPNTYSAKTKIEGPEASWTSPVCVVGKNDVTHVFYQDSTNQRLYWRTLSAKGVLSRATRIDTDGTSSQAMPHTNAVYYADSDKEIVVIGYADKKGILNAVTITDGVVGPVQPFSSSPVYENAKGVTNEGSIAHLALDGTDVHAMWAERSSGDIKHRARPHGGAWTAETTVWDSESKAALYVYCNVFVRKGQRRLGYTYDVGPFPDEKDDIRYNEIVLGPAN